MKRTSSYEEIITLFNRIHMMRMSDPMFICVETTRIDNECSLEKEFIELIQVDSCHNYVSGLLT